MNREIKFRVWDNAVKKYLSLKDYQDLGAIEVENDGTLTLSPRYRFLINMMIMPERFVPQQYTGLKDKNGVEIYEGDKVKAKFYDKEVVGEIGFSDGCFLLWNSCVSDNQLFVFDDIEVIGNIYENEVEEVKQC